MSLNLYLLTFKGHVDYDSYDAQVLCAESEAAARAMFGQPRSADGPRCGDECGQRWGSRSSRHDCVWSDPAQTSCRLLGVAAEDIEAGLVCASFRAG